MSRIESVDAWEVLDSRGSPTVRVRVATPDGSGTFTVPSGASTGAHEAIERRDGGDRYGGGGVRMAVAAVRDELADVVTGRDATAQQEVDAALVERDGTADLSRCGANAVLGVSGAVAHAASAARDVPLYEHVAGLAAGETRSTDPGALPLPMINVLSGGLHAEGGIEIQDFLVIPAGADSYGDALETVWEVREAVRQRIVDAGHRPLVADEGGFAPPLAAIENAFDVLAAGVHDAGHEPAREDVAFAVDVAATHFYDEESETYVLDSVDRRFDAEGMADLVAGWVDEWPLVSIEDPLAEDDWDAWERLHDRIGADVQLLGDDLIVTDGDRLGRAIERGVANAVLVKPNQAGTLTHTIEVTRDARAEGFAPVVSARSGETCDSTIADLAVGLDAGQIKIGSFARSERLAKYNRLLAIERDIEGFARPTFGGGR